MDLPVPGRPPELDSVTIHREGGRRYVDCFCGKRILRSIVPHLKKEHVGLWEDWSEDFVKLRGLGYPLKKIMRLFKAADGNLLFSWTVIERTIWHNVESGKSAYRPPSKKRVSSWQPDSFLSETTTVWDFPHRGNWAVHSGDYHGNWPPQIPRNLINRYTQFGDIVVDAFTGGGTTLVEAWILGRRSFGLDLSRMSIQTVKSRLREMEDLATGDDRILLDPQCRPVPLEGSALQLGSTLRGHDVRAGDVKLICAHPPYLDSVAYTIDNPDDLSRINDPQLFTAKIGTFAKGALSLLSPEGVLALLIGDVRKNGETVPLGLKTLESLLSAGFGLHEVVVKTQHQDRSTEFYVHHLGGRLQLAHEYLFILGK